MNKVKAGDWLEVTENGYLKKAGDIVIVDKLDSQGDYLGEIQRTGRYFCVGNWNTKLAERNPMPKLEAGMAVEVRSVAHGYIEKYVVCGDMLIDVNGDWNAARYLEDGTLDVLSVWGRVCCHQTNWFKNLGEPIWQRNDNSAELEQLAELKKTIADAQKQADELEEAMNGRR